jgi:hypothetical protein
MKGEISDERYGEESFSDNPFFLYRLNHTYTWIIETLIRPWIIIAPRDIAGMGGRIISYEL